MNEGTKEAIEFLIAKGHRRIGILNGPRRDEIIQGAHRDL